ncbi:MAG: patatin-like phospholipase family protein [Chloroflexi bacterium]|nr:patatin-like phospholipase family protein [Chloroflexota bacterium]
MNITLALGGGGAKGNSHIGVIRRLEKEGYKIDAVAGTSFGGIVAVFYAAGYSSDQIENLFSSLDQASLYGHSPDQGPSLLGLAGAAKWLKEVFGEKTFADLKLPCAVTAVDLKSGNEVTLSKGRVVDALLATVAVPGVLPHVTMGEWELVDGGVLNPVPVSVARSLAPKLPVVAVVLTEPLGVPARTWTLPVPNIIPHALISRLARVSYARAFDIFLRSLDIVDRAIAEYRLEVDKPDVIIRPRVNGINIFDKVDVRAVARLGEEATEMILPELKKSFTWQSRLRRALGVEL